jgi:dTDP-4-dehydrorhamnose 3,5-epimerase
MLSFHDTELAGVVVVESEPTLDERGSFARTYSEDEFAERGIPFVPRQISTSYNRRRGTLRGLHYQAPPREEAKLVSCLSGSAFDVAVDLRRASPTFGRWVFVELSADEPRSIYIPPGYAHGFQTLEDDTRLLYLISDTYDATLQRGVRWNDPLLAVEWPEEPTVVSDRDRGFPDLDP